MNICFYYINDPEPTCGGIERVCLNLIPELQKSHSIFFCCLHQRRTVPMDNVVMYPLPDPSEPSSENNCQHLKRFIVENQIDVLLAHSYTHNPICDKAVDGTKCRLIYAFHCEPRCAGLGAFDVLASQKYAAMAGGCLLPYIYSLLKLPISYLVRNYRMAECLNKMYDASHILVFLSERFLPIYKKYSRKNNIERARAIPNPVPPIHKTIDYGKKKKQVLVVSRMEIIHKRVDRILYIWHRVQSDFPDWELILLGSGPQLSFFQELATKLGLKRISFKGAVDAFSYYEEASILCLTSSAEGFGMVLAEAQQHGCVPIAYDSYASVRDIITHGENGLLVPPFRERTYAKLLSRLMSDHKARERMGKNGEQTVQKFHPEAIAEKWNALFSSL